MDHVGFLFLGQGTSLGDVMPFLQTAPAAGPCSMLGYKDRVSPHRRLPAVVGRIGWSQSFPDKVLGVTAQNLRSFFRGIIAIIGLQGEAGPEAGLGQTLPKVPFVDCRCLADHRGLETPLRQDPFLLEVLLLLPGRGPWP